MTPQELKRTRITNQIAILLSSRPPDFAKTRQCAQSTHLFNKRLLLLFNISSPTFQMYVELHGDNTQEKNNMPWRVYLKLRHLGASYFRDGTGKIKEFRQPLASWRKFEFNRFAITNTTKCNQEKMAGNSK